MVRYICSSYLCGLPNNTLKNMNNLEKKNIFRRILMSNIFENIYHFLLMYAWLLLSIAGAFVGLVIIIFVLFYCVF